MIALNERQRQTPRILQGVVHRCPVDVEPQPWGPANAAEISRGTSRLKVFCKVGTELERAKIGLLAHPGTLITSGVGVECLLSNHEPAPLAARADDPKCIRTRHWLTPSAGAKGSAGSTPRTSKPRTALNSAPPSVRRSATFTRQRYSWARGCSSWASAVRPILARSRFA